MAIARLSTTDLTAVENVASITDPHDAGSASDRALAMGGFDQGNDRVTSLTFDSLGLAQIVKKSASAADTSDWIYLYLDAVSLSTSTHDIVLTRSVSDANQLLMHGAVYSGVVQSNTPNASNSAEGTAVTTLSFTLTTTIDDCWAFSGARSTAGGELGGTNFTIFTSSLFGDSNASLGAAGGKTIQCTYNLGNAALISMALAPSVTVDPNVFDSVTITEAVTMMVDENPNVFDAVTLTEAVTMMMDLNIDVFDGVTITEDVSLFVFFPIDIFVVENITVSESVTMLIDPLVPSVFDAITVTEPVTAIVFAAADGLVRLRSSEQSYPLMMDDDENR